VFVAGKTEVIRLSAATGEKEKLFGAAAGVGLDNFNLMVKGRRARALAVSRDGKRLACSDGDVAWMVEPENPGNHGTFGGPTPKGVELAGAGVAWSPDGKRLVSISPKRTDRAGPFSGVTPDTHWPVRVWSTEGEGHIRSLLGHDQPVTALAWSKDGAVIASGDAGGVIILWDAASGKELWQKQYGDGGGRVHALALSPEDNTVAMGVWLGSRKTPERVVLLAGKDGAELQHLIGSSDLPVTSVAWAKDGKYLVTGCGALPGRAVPQDETPVGEVTVWERQP
jgi:WD40 repeat protein